MEYGSSFQVCVGTLRNACSKGDVSLRRHPRDSPCHDLTHRPVYHCSSRGPRLPYYSFSQHCDLHMNWRYPVLNSQNKNIFQSLHAKCHPTALPRPFPFPQAAHLRATTARFSAKVTATRRSSTQMTKARRCTPQEKTTTSPSLRRHATTTLQVARSRVATRKYLLAQPKAMGTLRTGSVVRVYEAQAD